MASQVKPSKILIEMDLVFNIKSLIDVIKKDTFAKYDNIKVLNYIEKSISKQLDYLPEELSFDSLSTISDEDKSVNELSNEETVWENQEELNNDIKNFLSKFDLYKNTIKPNLVALEFIHHLNASNIEVCLINSSYNGSLASELSEMLKNSFEFKIEMKSLEELEELSQDVDPSKVLLISDCERTLQHLESIVPESKIFEFLPSKSLQSSRFQTLNSLRTFPFQNYEIPSLDWKKGQNYVDREKQHEEYELKSWSTYTPLPNKLIIKGEICHGFGRGGAELRLPTANVQLGDEQQEQLACTIPGIFFGYASLCNPGSKDFSAEIGFGERYRTFVSIGYNPQFSTREQVKTIEANIAKNFKGNQFYGAVCELTLIGYIRPEARFESLSDLCKAMELDLAVSNDFLDQDQ